MRVRSPPVLLYVWCSALAVVIAYPDRSTLQIVRQLLDRVKDIDEVHIVEAKLLSDPKQYGFSHGPSSQQGANQNHPNKLEAAASSHRQVFAGNDPRQQMMFVDVGSILGLPQLGVLRVPLWPSQNRAQGQRQWIPPNHSSAESQRLNLAASSTPNLSKGNQTNVEPPQASRNHRSFNPHPSQQHQQNRQPPLAQSQHQPQMSHFPVVILEATIAREIHSATPPHGRPGVNVIGSEHPHRLIRSNTRPPVTINDFNPNLALPSVAVPQLRSPPAHISKATERHSPPAWAPATAFAESAEFSQIPTLTANPVHRSRMVSVRRLLGRPDEENIIITLPQATKQPVGANGQPVQQQQTTTTESPKPRDVIRSKFFPQNTRKPSRRLVFKYLG